MNSEVNTIIAKEIDTNNSWIFADITTDAEVPLYTLGRPNFNALNVHEAWHKLYIVPQTLEHFNPADAKPLYGNENAYISNSSLVLKYDSAIAGKYMPVIIRFTDGSELSGDWHFTEFETQTGKWIYVRPGIIPLRHRGKK